MNNKKKKIIIISVVLILTVSFALILLNNLGILKKLKASVIDANTGLTCTDCELESNDIIYEKTYSYEAAYEGSGESGYSNNYNSQYVSDALYHLSEMSNSYCKNGYKCEGKPQLLDDENSTTCTSISADQISFSNELSFDDTTLGHVDDINESPENIDEALENYYKVYNSDYYCPQKYCVPEVYEINLDPNGGTGGTTKIYEKFGVSYYLDSDTTIEMGKLQNPITLPTKSYTITYDDNEQGATFTPGPASVNGAFAGYFPTQSLSNDIIESQGGFSNIIMSVSSNSYNGPYGEFQIFNRYNSNSDPFIFDYWSYTDSEENLPAAYTSYSDDEFLSSFSNSLIDTGGYLNIYKCWFVDLYGATECDLRAPSNYTDYDAFGLDHWLYFYYEDNGISNDSYYVDNDDYNDSNTNQYFGTPLTNTLYAQYELGKLQLPEITKEDYTCFWEDPERGLNYHPSGEIAFIDKDTEFNAVCIPNNKFTVVTYACDSDGSNCQEYSRYPETYSYESYGSDYYVSPNSIDIYDKYYDCPDGFDLTADNNYTINFYCTESIYASNYIPSTSFMPLSINVNSNNTAANISTSEYYPVYDEINYTYNNQYYNIRIWPAGQDGGGENNILSIPSGSDFNYSYFDDSSLNGYDATYRGKYGIYFIKTDDENSYYEPLEFRPYIKVVYKVDGEEYATDVKEANNSLTLRTIPQKSGYDVIGWQAFTETKNSTGMNGTTATSYTACKSESYNGGDYAGNVYIQDGQYLDDTDWNFSNYSYPCPSYDGYVDNIITVYLEALYKKQSWYTIE